MKTDIIKKLEAEVKDLLIKINYFKKDEDKAGDFRDNTGILNDLFDQLHKLEYKLKQLVQ